jgi:hypothetical protein
MQKVVAFLEKYAEWVALGVAAIFVLFVAYSYVLSPEQLKVSVGNDKEKVLPGDVDPHIAGGAAQRLQQAVDAGADVKFPVRDFTKEFEVAMGPQRRSMEPKYLVTLNPLPGVAREMEIGGSSTVARQVVEALPVVPTPRPTGTATGNSLVAKPPPVVDPNDPNAAAAAAAAAAAQQNPAVELANALDKNWVTVEFSLSSKELMDAWAKTFPKPKPGVMPIPPAAMFTHFLYCEVEREEQIAPGKWGNRVKLKPLPLFQVEELPPNNSDPNDLEFFRVWAEQHQVDIVEPAFYRTLKGDQWYQPSVGPAADPSAAGAVADNTPFDPANPPTNRQLTPQEKQQVYLYNLKIKQEQQKALAAERKAKLDAAAAALKAKQGSGSSEGGGRRSMGGYAPLPIELASSPDTRAGGGRAPAGPGGGRTPAGPPAAGAGRTPAVTPPVGRQPAVPSPESGERSRIPAGPAGEFSTMQPGTALPTQPFDPSKLVPDLNGKTPDIVAWAHDETVVPGKTYRYRMTIYMKNPVYGTSNVTKNEGDAKLLAIKSQPSEWTKEVNVPRTTTYFFANARENLKEKTVYGVTVDVFKREKGEWNHELFSIAPGDAIGATGKSGIDYSTGFTLVDLRKEIRGDVRIITADQDGNLDTTHLTASASDPWYKELLNKLQAPPTTPPGVTPAPGVAPTPGTPTPGAGRGRESTSDIR